MEDEFILTQAHLSAEKVLTMPAEDYMNQSQRELFRNLLEDMRQNISRHVTNTTKHLREKEEFADPADRATQEELQGLELRTCDRERKLQYKIEAAIARIDAGNYGYCEETGEPIGLPRLLARPTATLCLEAQERHERRERQFSK